MVFRVFVSSWSVVSIRCAAVRRFATVITKNEADAIADALKSLAWGRECRRRRREHDDTLLLRAVHRACLHPAWNGYVDQKNYAADLATHDWIFSLDADETRARGAERGNPRADGIRADAAGATGCRASPSISADGCGRRTCIRTISCACITAARPGRGCTSTNQSS